MRKIISNKIYFISIFIFIFTFEKNIYSFPLKFGFEAGLLPFVGIKSSYVIKKIIGIEIGTGIKAPIYAKHYYFFKWAVRIYPFVYYNKLKYLSFSIAYQPSLSKYGDFDHLNKYKMNWLNFYFDIGFQLFKCILGIGLDINVLKFGHNKYDKTIIYRPLIFIYHDIIQWFKK